MGGGRFRELVALGVGRTFRQPDLKRFKREIICFFLF